MQKILHFKRNTPSIGLLVRRSNPGPERNFIRRFVDRVKSEYRNESKHLAIFQEPSLATGFPDVVFVEYNPRAYEHWAPSRFSLGQNDLKVLHHIFHAKGTTSKELERLLGLDPSRLLRILEVLLDAKLIRRYAKEWHTSNRDRIFALYKIIAVEGKINDMKSAFHQAWVNKWFASESYILTPSFYQNRDEFKKIGVGIFTFHDRKIERVQAAKKLDLPHSYASWMFNEWVGRQTQLETSH